VASRECVHEVLDYYEADAGRPLADRFFNGWLSIIEKIQTNPCHFPPLDETASESRIVFLIDDTLEQRNDHSGERGFVRRFGCVHCVDDAWDLDVKWIDDTDSRITLPMIQIFRVNGVASELQSSRNDRRIPVGKQVAALDL